MACRVPGALAGLLCQQYAKSWRGRQGQLDWTDSSNVLLLQDDTLADSDGWVLPVAPR